MRDAAARPPATRARRLLRRLRFASLLIILFGPIALGGWHVHVAAPALGTGPRGATDDDRVARYLARRSPIVDRLLPEGRGGTRFYDHLAGSAGVASAGAAAIGLSLTADLGFWPESVELHERAHLLHAFAPGEAAAVLAALTGAAPGEYARTNQGEHFAEMAAKAWEIVAPPDGVCLDATPVARLADAETRVPGTAGFVLRFLTEMRRTGVEGDDDVRALANRLSAPARDAWSALWRAVDARRQANDTFQPWGARTIREYIAVERHSAAARGWLGRFASVAYLPSLALATLLDGLD